MSGQEGNDNASAAIEAEFSRPVDVTTPGRKGRHFEFEATEGERAALARRYSVVSVNRLEARCDIIPAGKGQLRFKSEFTAEVVQLCIISLEPVEEEISAQFTLLLCRPSRQHHQDITDIDFTPDDKDIEFLKSDMIDVGEIIAQYLSLEINPYPRKQEAAGPEFGQRIITEGDSHIEIERKNPFELLKSLKH